MGGKFINMENYSWINYGPVPSPKLMEAQPVPLTDETMALRLQRVRAAMAAAGLEALCIYGDREHGGNFGYLAGFEPRFEEAVMVLHKEGPVYLLFGNESLKMGAYCRTGNAKVIHVPFFSLPNQPMDGYMPLTEVFKAAGLCAGMSVGIVGWKMFTCPEGDPTQLFEVPYMIVQSIKEVLGSSGHCVNAGSLFIHPGAGVRCINNANEIAHFEFGAALASNGVGQVLEAIEPGKTELLLAGNLNGYGQSLTVQTICASGARFINGEIAPRNKAVCEGEPFSVTMGLRGGLTSRAGYVVKDEKALPGEASDYMEALVKPYYAAAVTWYENIRIGITGGELYDCIEKVLPKAVYGWNLNPGHLTASEEWLSSPIGPASDIPIQSGMLLQMDIIPKRAGYGGVNAEDGIAVADEKLRKDLALYYPKTWERICIRRQYMREHLGICLAEEILPLSNTEGYLRPYLLEKNKAVYVCRDHRAGR